MPKKSFSTTFATISKIFFCIGVSGSFKFFGWEMGFGSALLSILPFAVTGILSIWINTSGTM